MGKHEILLIDYIITIKGKQLALCEHILKVNQKTINKAANLLLLLFLIPKLLIIIETVTNTCHRVKRC